MSQNELKLWKVVPGNMKSASRRYVKKILARSKQIDTTILFLTYAGCSARQLEEILEETHKHVHFERVIIQKASATVSGNCGVGVFGLMFVRKVDKEDMEELYGYHYGTEA